MASTEIPCVNVIDGRSSFNDRKSFRSGGGSAPGHHSSQAVYFSQQRPQPTDLTVADSEVRINAKFNFNVKKQLHNGPMTAQHISLCEFLYGRLR